MLDRLTQGDYWGYGGEGKGNTNEELEVDQIKGQGKGTQCYRCQGYGHMARDCATEKGAMPKGKGKCDYGKGDYSKGKGKVEDRYCYNCGKK